MSATQLYYELKQLEEATLSRLQRLCRDLAVLRSRGLGSKEDIGEVKKARSETDKLLSRTRNLIAAGDYAKQDIEDLQKSFKQNS